MKTQRIKAYPAILCLALILPLVTTSCRTSNAQDSIRNETVYSESASETFPSETTGTTVKHPKTTASVPGNENQTAVDEMIQSLDGLGNLFDSLGTIGSDDLIVP